MHSLRNAYIRSSGIILMVGRERNEIWQQGATLLPNFVSFAASIAEEQLRTHSLTHSPTLFDAPGTKALALRNKSYLSLSSNSLWLLLMKELQHGIWCDTIHITACYWINNALVIYDWMKVITDLQHQTELWRSDKSTVMAVLMHQLSRLQGPAIYNLHAATIITLSVNLHTRIQTNLTINNNIDHIEQPRSQIT